MLSDRQQGKLIRILRAETGDHPLIAEAVRATASVPTELNLTKWEQLALASDKLAVEIEDWVCYHGHPLDEYIREPWLSRWRQTCLSAISRL